MSERRKDPLPEQEVSESSFRWRSRRDFLGFAAVAGAMYTGWRWIRKSPREGQMPWQLRRAMEWNADVTHAVLDEHRTARTYPQEEANRDFRVNGDIGIDTDMEAADWRLQVVGVRDPHQYRQYVDNVDSWDFGYTTDDDDTSPQSDPNHAPAPDGGSKGTPSISIQVQAQAAPPRPGLLLTLDDLRRLPRTETVTRFKCIEGWSEVVWFGGVKFSDLLAAFPADRTRYIKMVTPSGDFYTGIEWGAAMHPQTLLAYELNGQPLSNLHGGPLRLSTPLKYGYKQIKQIASIEFTNQRPPDFWADNGYDWDGGL